jgi:predicted PurR-regulated permease PerM
MFAYLLDPVVDYFENAEGKNRLFRWRLPRGVTIFALGVVALLLLLSIPVVVIPQLILESRALLAVATVEEAQAAVDAASAAEPGVLPWYERFLERLPLDDLIRGLGWDEPGQSARGIVAQKLGTFVRGHALQLLQSLWSRLVDATLTFAHLAKASGQALIRAVFFLANVALFAFVAGYLLKDFDRLLAAARELVPPRHRPKTLEIAHKIDHQLRGFARGQMTVCLLLGLMYLIGLTVCGVPFALPIALFGMFASLLPYLGALMTLLPALLMAYLGHGLDWHIAGVLVTFAVVQGLEGNVLTPRIVGDKVGLHPVWVILAVLVFGSALGLLGVLLAVPLAASLKVLVVEGVQYYKRSPLFAGGSPSPGDGGTPPEG